MTDSYLKERNGFRITYILLLRNNPKYSPELYTLSQKDSHFSQFLQIVEASQGFSSAQQQTTVTVPSPRWQCHIPASEWSGPVLWRTATRVCCWHIFVLCFFLLEARYCNYNITRLEESDTNNSI